MAASYTLHVLASGNKTIATSSTQRSRLTRIETVLPEMTPVELRVAFSPIRLPNVRQARVTLPVVGEVTVPVPGTHLVNPAPYVAQAVNAAHAAGRFVIGTEPIALWDGATQMADHTGDTAVVRWKKGQPWNPLVLAVILAVGIAGFVVWQYLTHWTFFKAVAKDTRGIVHTVGSAGTWLVVGGVVLVGAIALNDLRRI